MHKVSSIFKLNNKTFLLFSNSYAAALEWLIENQSPTNFQLTDQSPAMNLSGKFLSTVSFDHFYM